MEEHEKSQIKAKCVKKEKEKNKIRENKLT